MSRWRVCHYVWLDFFPIKYAQHGSASIWNSLKLKSVFVTTTVKTICIDYWQFFYWDKFCTPKVPIALAVKSRYDCIRILNNIPCGDIWLNNSNLCVQNGIHCIRKVRRAVEDELGHLTLKAYTGNENRFCRRSKSFYLNNAHIYVSMCASRMRTTIN